MMKSARRRLRAAKAAAMKFFGRLREALSDKTRERNVVLLLAGYAAVWTVYDLLSRQGEDIHHDMGEMVAWSRDLALGSPKHPQMGAWIARLWFSVFPVTDWAFYLLANALIALSLWFAWRLSERYLSENKRVAGLAFLMLVPFFNFFAWKYNANTVLIPLWAAATFFTFRSLETRSPLTATLAGLAAAAAMMGKYWSVFLLIGLGVAALVSPHRRAYFRSAAPWITVGVGGLALAPHIYWVVTHGFPTVSYALKGHRAGTFAAALIDAGMYVSGIAAYLALPLLLLAWFARPTLSAFADTLWPPSASRRFVTAAFWLPILLPIPVALLNKTQLASIWAMPAFVLAPIVFLSSPKLAISRAAAAQLLAFAAVFSLLALAIAPARALRVRETGALNLADAYKPIAHAVEKQWRMTSDAPMAILGSDGNLVNGVSFYVPDRPSVLNIEREERTPSVEPARVRRQGIAMVCPEERESCVRAAERLSSDRPGVRRSVRAISRHYRGAASRAKRFLIITVPPEAAG